MTMVVIKKSDMDIILGTRGEEILVAALLCLLQHGTVEEVIEAEKLLEHLGGM